LAHAGLIAALLPSRPRLFPERGSFVGYPPLLLLPNSSTRSRTPGLTVQIDPPELHRSVVPDLTPPSIATDTNAITLTPSDQQEQRIDWDRESALAVQSTIAQAAKEQNYRDLSGLTPEQLKWVKQNHMEPMPGFQWDRNSRRELLRHGIVKINDYCVLIVVMPFCRFGGKIQYNGELFKNMHDPKSLDQ
jgi:hypothetical protein